jgi:hypothetical protein
MLVISNPFHLREVEARVREKFERWHKKGRRKVKLPEVESV